MAHETYLVRVGTVSLGNRHSPLVFEGISLVLEFNMQKTIVLCTRKYQKQIDLAYGDCTRSMSGSQNRTVPLKRILIGRLKFHAP